MTYDENPTARQQADFYLGSPAAEDMHYLGTVFDGDPNTVDLWSNFQTLTDVEFAERTFIATVAGMVDTKEWPHDHDTSADTPWAYCWHVGTLYVYRHGVEMGRIMSNLCKRQPDGGGGLAFRPRRPSAFPSRIPS